MFWSRIAFDPYLIMVMRADAGIVNKDSNKKGVQPLCSFSNSAMNIELVYIILTAINIVFDD